MFLISAAFAQDAVPTAANATSFLTNFFPIILIVAVFYFFLIAPQTKKQKEHQAMINSIARGEKVVTGGGIIGTIVKVEEDGIVMVEIAPDVRVKVQKSSITEVLSRTPAPAAAQDNTPSKTSKKEAK